MAPKSPKNSNGHDASEGARDQPTKAEEKNADKVARPIDEDAINERRLRLADLGIRMLDLRKEKTAQATELTKEIKEAEKEFEKLAWEVKHRSEMVDKQLAFEDAKQARRKTVRGTQDAEAPVATGAEP